MKTYHVSAAGTGTGPMAIDSGSGHDMRRDDSSFKAVLWMMQFDRIGAPRAPNLSNAVLI